MREIEVKYRVSDFSALDAKLAALGVELSPPTYQDDQAYAPNGWQFGDDKRGVSFVRLRTVNGRHWFALKQPTVNAQSCLEFETEVTEREAMHQAILHMGFYETVRVAKTRRTGQFGDVSLCLDELEGVGAFLELERMVEDDASAEAVQAELAALVVSLGVDAERTEETYDSLVRATRQG